MKNISLSIASLLFLIANSNVFSQDLTDNVGTTSLSKYAAKNGRYAGTYTIKDGGARTFYLYAGKKKEIMMDAYDFKSDGSFTSLSEGMTDMGEVSTKFDIDVDNEEQTNWSINESVLLIRTDLIGRLVVDKGKIKKEYDCDFKPCFFTGYEFESTDKMKPDARTRPAGFIPIGETVNDVTITDGGIKKVVRGSNNEGLMMESASVMVAGIITEKISLKASENKYNNNRLACQVFNGKDLSLISEKIHILPFACNLVSTSSINEDLGILYSTLKAPSSVKEANSWVAKDEDKKLMQYVRVDKGGNLLESVSFKSTSSRGMFRLMSHNDDAYVVGFIDEKHDGYYRWDVGKISHLQITKLSGGKMEKQYLISIDDLEKKAQGPKGEKMKFDITSKAAQGAFRFNWMYEMPNGDLLVTGVTPKEYFAIQINPSGELRAYYQIGRIEDDFIQYDFQVLQQNNSILLVIMEQPGDVTQGAHYSSTRYSQRVVRIDDIFTKGRVLRIDPESATISNQIDIGGKKYFMIGSNPCKMTDDGSEIYFAGTDRKKTLYLHSLK